VSGITSLEKQNQLISFQQIAKYVIPKTAPNTVLSYDFLKPITDNIITFEFLSSFGGSQFEISVPKVTLYKY
jgi:hypothetical protein